MKLWLPLVFLLASAGPARPASQWIKLTTPHFELYTGAGERKGREAILYFEQVRSFFEEVTPRRDSGNEERLRIVAFKSDQDYRSYRLNDFAIAFYTHREEREYIVLGDIAPDHYPVAIHEYAHRIIEHSGLRLPVWMNEGWAQLYSTLEPKGKKALVGSLIPGALQTLTTGNWIPLEELGRVGHDSPLYNEKNPASLFYAESWALMHMLFLSPEYAKHFNSFVASAASGKSLGESCASAFGRPLGAVELDLQKYIRGNRFYGALFPVKLTKSEEEPDATPVSSFESGLVLADLLAIEHKTAEAAAAYGALEAEGAGKPDFEEAVGYLDLTRGDKAGARTHFEKALSAEISNEKLCYRLGMLERREGGDKTIAVKAFERALALQPNDLNARLWLGITRLERHEYQKSLDTLAMLRRVGPEQAQFLFSAMAFDELQLGRDEDARKNAELARKWAKSPEQIANAENLLKFLDGKEAPRNF